MANRFLYSAAYKTLYLFLALLSFICIIIEFTDRCPSGVFTTFEIVINTALVLEVALRIFVQKWMYFKYVANLVDIVLVIICISTLSVLEKRTKCTTDQVTKLEEELDILLLVVRNLAQFFRLFVLMKRNQNSTQANYLDLNGSTLPVAMSVDDLDF